MSMDDLEGCLNPVSVVLILIFLYLTWPVGILFSISAGLWLFTRRSSRLWVKAIAYVFSAVTIGLGILCLTLFVLNAFKGTFDPNWVRSAEDFLYAFLLHLKAVNPSAWVTILILLALTVVTYYMPRWKLLDRFLWLKKAVSKTIIVLATITSFTFFGQLPMKEWVVQAHTRMVERYRVALREEWQFEGQYITAKVLEDHVSDLDEPRRHYYRTVYSAIKSEGFRDGTDYTSVVSEHMANVQSERTNEALKMLINKASLNTPPTEAKLPGEDLMERKPESAREMRAQAQVLAEQELRTSAAEAKATEAFNGLKKIFSEVITSQLPGIEGVTGFYLKKLVANYSELLFEKTIERYHRKAAQAGARAPVLASEMVQAAQAQPQPELAKQLLEPRLPAGMGELSIVGLAVATPLLRSQITKEVQRVTRLEANKAISNEIARRATSASRSSRGGSSGSHRGAGGSRPRPRPRGR